MKNSILFIQIILFLLTAERSESQSIFTVKDYAHYNYSIQQKDQEEKGIKNNLNDYGINLTVNFKNDFLENVSGGIKTGPGYIGLFKPDLSLDFSKMFHWDGAGMLISAIGNTGDYFNNKVGTEQGIDNIEAYNTWKIYELWIEQKLFNENLSLKFGLYDLNSEFDVRLSSLVFLNPSQAIGPEYSLTGKNGPSIFPATSVAFRIKYISSSMPCELSSKITGNDFHYFLQAAVLDGVPGDPDNPVGIQIIFNKNDGLLLAAETGIIKNEKDFGNGYEKYSLGGWYYSSGFKEFLNTNISGNPVYQKGNYGIYFSAEKFLFSEAKNPGEGLAGFLSIGISNKNINRVDSYFGAGINYTGLVPGRDKDQFGIALALAHNSSKYIIQMQSENIDISSYESIIEMTYLLKLSDWLKLQPDIQYVINPVYSLNNAYSFVSGIRIELIL